MRTGTGKLRRSAVFLILWGLLVGAGVHPGACALAGAERGAISGQMASAQHHRCPDGGHHEQSARPVTIPFAAQVRPDHVPALFSPEAAQRPAVVLAARTTSPGPPGVPGCQRLLDLCVARI